MNKPNWELIDRCGIWKVLGVTECDSCPSCKECWDDDAELPEPSEEGLRQLKELL